MKNIKIFMLATVLAVLLILSACDKSAKNEEAIAPPPETFVQIYLYGEQHGVEKIMDKEFEVWFDYYHTQNMGHLFVELPYYTAEFLNIWLKSESGDILDKLYDDMDGTAMKYPLYKRVLQDDKTRLLRNDLPRHRCWTSV